MNKINIFSLTRKQLKEILKDNDIPQYRADIIYKWIYDKGIFDFNKMSDISKTDRIKLNELFNIEIIKPSVVLKSNIDKTIKGALQFDNEWVEFVIIFDNKRITLCLSSQTGCSLKCKFCATGQYIGRNLKTEEIIYQYIAASNIIKKRITNIVFMGMGEPLLNLDNVFNAIRILNDPKGIQIGARKITVSTAGIIPGIYKIIDFPLQIKLAISLNSAIQKKREYIMPISKKYPLKQLKKVLKLYQKRKNKRITFEYIVLSNFNDNEDDINAIFNYLRDIDCKINIIPYNKTLDNEFNEPSELELKKFKEHLYKFKNAVMIRKSKGRDINGACGQLKKQIIM